MHTKAKVCTKATPFKFSITISIKHSTSDKINYALLEKNLESQTLILCGICVIGELADTNAVMQSSCLYKAPR